MKLFTIGELAKVTGIHVETIRFYQRRGLLVEPQRPLGGIRRYGEAEAARIQFIKSAQKLGFSLDEVIALLILEDGTRCKEAREIAEQKLSAVRSKIANLSRMEETLSNLTMECTKRRGKICCPLISSLRAR
jgi:MerR family mercuric resistance operon transcriptional regulator